jgi:hypothetical protein
MANEKQGDQRTLGDDVGYIVGVAVVLVILVNVGAGAAVAKAMQGIKANIPEYVQFGYIYLSTFALSLSVTAGIAAYAIPRIYGKEMHWAVTPAVLVVGALLTIAVTPDLRASFDKVHLSPRLIPHGRFSFAFEAVFFALFVFVKVYGTGLLGGVIVGSAAGLILAVTVQHHVTARGAVSWVIHPWTGGAVGNILFMLGMGLLVAYLISQSPAGLSS